MIEIAPFSTDHLDAALALSRAEGWPHRREDWAMLLHLSRGWVALDGNRVIGTAFSAEFGSKRSTLGMIIVAKENRGQGIGRRLMTPLIDGQRSYQLIATPEGRPLYEKLGFVETGQVVQCQGILAMRPNEGSAGPMVPDDLAAITDLESKSFGGDRFALASWLQKNASLAVTRVSGRVTSFAALRAFGKGHVIGPIVAPDIHLARVLIAHLARDLEGKFLRLDVAASSKLAPWLAHLGLSPVDTAPIMEIRSAGHVSTRMAVFSQALG